jgi:hypothetical protein
VNSRSRRTRLNHTCVGLERLREFTTGPHDVHVPDAS